VNGLRQPDDSQPADVLTQTSRHPWHLGQVRSVAPADAGWTYCGLEIVALGPGEAVELTTGGAERAVLPLSGGPLVVEVEARRFELSGRATVFEAVTDWAYLPIDAEVRLSSITGAEVAMPSARATRRFDPAMVRAAAVAIETRGAGPATRQVTNFMSPEAFDGADKLMCVELLTPDGNWSSYPPHRHDDSPECPVNNEEIYYFRIGRAGTTDYAPDGFAMHRTYTAARGNGRRAVDVNVAVVDGDVFVIPRGYHGPCVAAPGYPLYYLNVLAGPAGERSMAFCDDPSHHWVRDSWTGMPTDPRVPMTRAAA
jgi:5-deoxy-glucuronate isomerase